MTLTGILVLTGHILKNIETYWSMTNRYQQVFGLSNVPHLLSHDDLIRLVILKGQWVDALRPLELDLGDRGKEFASGFFGTGFHGVNSTPRWSKRTAYSLPTSRRSCLPCLSSNFFLCLYFSLSALFVFDRLVGFLFSSHVFFSLANLKRHQPAQSMV